MLQVYCHATRENGICTIQQGIVGADGVRRGAIADIDLFDCFTVKMNADFDLWELKDKRDRTVINRKAAKRIVEITPSNYDDDGNFVPSPRVQYLANAYAAAADLMAEAGVKDDDFIEGVSPMGDD